MFQFYLNLVECPYLVNGEHNNIMPAVQRTGDLASCGDPIDLPLITPTVFVGGQPIAKVGLSTVGGTTGKITGPGAITVFAEGFMVSVAGDGVIDHPGTTIVHTGVTLLLGSPNVNAG